MKRYESAMRHLLDSYICADDSAVFSEFAELGLVELIVTSGLEVLEELPDGLKKYPVAMAIASQPI
jgi:type I restriction enzyme, R subunit